MKRVRRNVLACQLQPSRNPRTAQHFRNLLEPTPLRPSGRSLTTCLCVGRPCQRPQPPPPTPALTSKRWTTVQAAGATESATSFEPSSSVSQISLRRPADPAQTNFASNTARLSALHARLQLPPELSLSTLARCLIHASADPNPARNNASLATLGQDLLAYYTSEYIIVNYPRLPVPIIFAAQYAYSGAATLAALRAEWGVELAAAPGPEVNKALLQFKRVQPGNALAQDGISQVKDLPSSRKLGLRLRGRAAYLRRGTSGRIAQDDEFGDIRSDVRPYPGAAVSSKAGSSSSEVSTGAPERNPSSQPERGQLQPVTAEEASATFIRALAGALYLHSGDEAVKSFHADHILSRHFELHKMFDFKQPTFDLSRLCARENFEPPIARLLSETGRMSRTPVFVVGVFSGEDKLGEGAGASLNEARVRAAASALRAWYLYSPPVGRIMRPSDMEDGAGGRLKTWIPQMVDPGEIVA